MKPGATVSTVTPDGASSRAQAGPDVVCLPAVASTATMAGVGSALTRGAPIHQVAVIVAGCWIRPLPWPERPPVTGPRSLPVLGAGRDTGQCAGLCGVRI